MKLRTGSSLPIKLAVPVGLILASLPACNDSGGGGGSSGIPAVIQEDETVANDTPATANALPVGTPVQGEVAVPGDVDVFELNLTQGEILEIELFAVRHDQSTWDANINVPRLTLLDTDAHGNAKLLEHDYSGNFSDGWEWGRHDLDMPMFKVPSTGTYFIAVTQDSQARAGGSYVMRAHYLTVDGLQQETEAAGTTGGNDDAASAQTIDPGTLHGYHVASEVDFYEFTLTVPTIVRFELTAYRNGVCGDSGRYYDSYLYLYDADGTTRLTSNDDACFYDSGIQYRFVTAGTYYIVVDEYEPSEGDYFLTYTRSPGDATAENEPNDVGRANTISYGGRRSGTVDVGDTDLFKFTGTAGDMVRLQYFDSSNGQGMHGNADLWLLAWDGWTPLPTGGGHDFQTLTTILQYSGTFYVGVADTGSMADYAIELTRFKSATEESEPNDSDPTANSLGATMAGVIDPGGDVDVFKVDLTAHRLVRVCVFASADFSGDFEYSDHGSDMTPLIEIFDSNGTMVARSTGDPAHGVTTESVTDPLPVVTHVGAPDTTGTYFVHISDATGGSGPAHYYVVEFLLH